MMTGAMVVHDVMVAETIVMRGMLALVARIHARKELGVSRLC